MKVKLIQFIGLFLLMLVTGVFWGTWFTLTRSITEFTPAEFIHIGKVIIANVALPMRIIMPSCILILLLSVWYYPQKFSPGFYYSITSAALIIITLLITLLVLVPIDNQIKGWTEATVPQNWEEIRDRWQSYHTIRTFSSISSFIFFVLSMMDNRRTFSFTT